jgi:hypothetical protein
VSVAEQKQLVGQQRVGGRPSGGRPGVQPPAGMRRAALAKLVTAGRGCGRQQGRPRRATAFCPALMLHLPLAAGLTAVRCTAPHPPLSSSSNSCASSRPASGEDKVEGSTALWC